MNDQPSSYISPKAIARPVPSKKGWGVFAKAPIAKDELIITWGGNIIHESLFDALSRDEQRLCVQVDEGLFMVPSVVGPGDYINHSCEPNAGIRGQISVVAMREISVGEELSFDYAMTDGDSYDEFECQCGASTCRKNVIGNDWKRPELIARYKGYYSTYLEQRIDHLIETGQIVVNPVQ